MTDIAAQAFTIKGTMDLPTDEYSADVASSEVFLEASDEDTIKLSAGLIDPATEIEYTVGHLEGPIEKYGLSSTPNDLKGTVHGRDQLVELLEQTYQKLYLRKQPPPQPKIRVVDEWGRVTLEDQPAGTLGPDKIPFVVGNFAASDVAKHVVESVGLSLSWQCRDYTLLEDFDATGRPIDILKRLVEPWSQVSVFKVDVFVQGGVVFCRARLAAPVADYTFTAKDARIKTLTVSKVVPWRAGNLYGEVHLQGRMVPTLGGANVVQGGEVQEVSTSETRDEAGEVLTRVVKTTTYRMPERIVLRVREQTYNRQEGALKLASDKQTENEWEASQYDVGGPTKQPKQLGQTTLTSGIAKTDPDKRFQVVKKEEVRFSHDTDGYQDLTTTRRYDAKFTTVSGVSTTTASLPETEREIRALKEVEHLKTEETVSLYKASTPTPTEQNPAPQPTWYLAAVDTHVSAGLRPGGTRPGRVIIVGGGDQTSKEPLEVRKTFSSDARAKDARYQNQNLDLDDLRFILSQFEAASGLWLNELTMQYVSMPWIRKGNVLWITDWKPDGVTDVPLQPALITEQELRFDEASDRPEMVSTLSALFWSAT